MHAQSATATTTQHLPRPESTNRWFWAGIDLLIIVACIYITAWLRYDFNVQAAFSPPIHRLVALSAVIHVVIGIAVGPYAIGHQRGSYEEVADLAKTVVTWVCL